MPLLRPSEKQLAARRANARKSTGPRTPEGKARAGQNACKHHLYARTHSIPPEWEARIIPQVVEATAEFAADQHRRDLRARHLYLELWAIELDALAEHHFNQILAQYHNDFRSALRHWLRRESLYSVIHKRRMHIHHQVMKIIGDICRYERDLARSHRIPVLQRQPPRARAAGAGAGAAENSPSTEPTCIYNKKGYISGRHRPPSPPAAAPAAAPALPRRQEIAPCHRCIRQPTRVRLGSVLSIRGTDDDET